MQKNMDLRYENANWDVVQLLTCKKMLPYKWVHKLKITDTESKPKYKARLVAKGFKKQYWIDFKEVFSLVVNMTTLHCVLALVS